MRILTRATCFSAFLLLLTLLHAPAYAGHACDGTVGTPVCDEGQAYAACLATPTNNPNFPSTKWEWAGPVSCEISGAGNFYHGERPYIDKRYEPHSTKYMANGSFYFRGLCADRETVYAGYHDQVEGNHCYGGCEYTKGPPIEGPWRVDQHLGNSIQFERGQWSATGEVCGVSNPPPPPKDDYCALLDGGYKVCRDSRGRNCVVSGKTGRKYCPSSPDQSMNATNPDRTENVTQSGEAAAPGTPPQPPSPRPGENFKPSTSTSITNITNNTTTNTTFNNQTGTPNTNPGSGNPGDGSDNPGTGEGEGEGDGDGDEGTASGGGGCGTPPTTTGDVLTGFLINQVWLTRCADYDPEILAALNAAQVLSDAADALGEESAEDLVDIFDDDQDPIADARLTRDLSDIELDDSGFLGGGACPSLPPLSLGSVTVPLDITPLCDVLSNISGIIMALSYVIAFRIIAGGFN